MLTKELLKNTDIGKRLSSDCLDAVFPILMKNSYSRTFESGEVIRHRGDPAENLMIVKDGCIKSVDYTKRGEQMFFYYFSRYEVAGLIGCINNTFSRSDNVAEQRTTIVYVPRGDYLRACALIPEFQGEVLRLICRKADKQIEISILSRCKYARDRLCLWLFHQYTHTRNINISIDFTIEALANFLGLTRACLSKELHTLESEGIIELARRKIRIKDLNKLKKYI